MADPQFFVTVHRMREHSWRWEILLAGVPLKQHQRVLAYGVRGSREAAWLSVGRIVPYAIRYGRSLHAAQGQG